jgi:2-keto-3-deoxy-L-rhamnonate aldolase RhmA
MTSTRTPDAARPRGPRVTNRLRDGLDDGRAVTVAASVAMSSDLVDLLGSTAFDGVWLEGESGSLTWDRLADLGRAAELWDLAAVVRIPAFEPWRAARALSLGAHGVVLPQVSGVAEAAAFVASARFSPFGTRGISRGRRSYGRPDYFAEEAVSPVTVVQVEHVDVLAHVEAICAVPGLDVVFVAPYDLADSMGLIGQVEHPDVVAAVLEGVRRINACGVAAGTLATPASLQRLVDAGARFLYVSVDGVLTSAIDELLPQQ